MGSLIESIGLNLTVAAQVINFILLLIFLVVPIGLLIYFFSAVNDIRRRVANIENILTVIKEQQDDFPSQRKE